jgi:hypothetical protein
MKKIMRESAVHKNEDDNNNINTLPLKYSRINTIDCVF